MSPEPERKCFGGDEQATPRSQVESLMSGERTAFHKENNSRDEEEGLLPFTREERAIEVLRRWERLPELQDLPRQEWVEQINNLYPDVVTVQAIQEDLRQLDEIANEVIKFNKKIEAVLYY